MRTSEEIHAQEYKSEVTQHLQEAGLPCKEIEYRISTLNLEHYRRNYFSAESTAELSAELIAAQEAAEEEEA